MADIAAELAGKCGISVDAAQKGLGVLLGHFKSKLPAESFTKVSEAVPGADSMMAAADTGEQASGGVISAVKGAVGKIFGGGGVNAVISKFSSLGMSAEQAQGFLSKAIEALKSRLPENVMKQIAGLLPIPQATTT